jgi:hypothetical protein
VGHSGGSPYREIIVHSASLPGDAAFGVTVSALASLSVSYEILESCRRGDAHGPVSGLIEGATTANLHYERDRVSFFCLPDTVDPRGPRGKSGPRRPDALDLHDALALLG